ncbi:RraA family protein [Halalkalibaculum sp. DA384]|uniref:RraA family protein n=1 Tax=Halalkalibaculum sp. DA384 TaxID=3373606 RepID=UPI003754D146
MNPLEHFFTRRFKQGILLVAAFILCLQVPLNAQKIPRQTLISMTSEWEGERYPDGRPKVPADVLERMEEVSIEEAWGTLRQHDYHNQFAGGPWKILKPGEVMVGRALTATYYPARPGVQKHISEQQEKAGHTGPTNTWPIDMLNQGDLYVANGFGKIKDGTLIGDRLGNTIYANSGNGVVFEGSSRDREGLSEIEGFNAFVRDWDPSFIQHMMLIGLNTPTLIGEATVMPGDVVLAKQTGVIFIPAHLAEEVVIDSERTRLRDGFAHQRVQDGTYTAGQMDTEWTDEIRQDFENWLRSNSEELQEKFGVGQATIDELLEE